MQILIEECKKAFKSPVLLGLVLLFSAFNIFLIVSDSYFKEELKIANELSKTYGLEITDDALQQFEQDLRRESKELMNMTGESFDSVQAFLDQLPLEAYDQYSADEQDSFEQLALKEVYFERAKSIDEDYSKINVVGMAESTIEMYGLSGKPADVLRHEYKKLEQRFEEMIANNEHKEWFVLGKPYLMHSMLFRSLFQTFLFEALLLIVLTTAFLTAFEFENKTHLLTYSTKQGRLLMKHKLIASLMTSLSFVLFILAVTLLTYFFVFDYSYLWKSSISSALNWEYNIPYITWWDMPFWKYLLLTILLLMICFVLFSVLTFAIATVVKNSYFTFFIFAILFAIGFLLPGFMPTSSLLFIASLFNLPIVVMNPHMLFMGNSGITVFKYHELLTIGIWSIVMMILYGFVMKYMKKIDLA